MISGFQKRRSTFDFDSDNFDRTSSAESTSSNCEQMISVKDKKSENAKMLNRLNSRTSLLGKYSSASSSSHNSVSSISRKNSENLNNSKLGDKKTPGTTLSSRPNQIGPTAGKADSYNDRKVQLQGNRKSMILEGGCRTTKETALGNNTRLTKQSKDRNASNNLNNSTASNLETKQCSKSNTELNNMRLTKAINNSTRKENYSKSIVNSNRLAAKSADAQRNLIQSPIVNCEDDSENLLTDTKSIHKSYTSESLIERGDLDCKRSLMHSKSVIDHEYLLKPLEKKKKESENDTEVVNSSKNSTTPTKCNPMRLPRINPSVTSAVNRKKVIVHGKALPADSSKATSTAQTLSSNGISKKQTYGLRARNQIKKEILANPKTSETGQAVQNISNCGKKIVTARIPRKEIPVVQTSSRVSRNTATPKEIITAVGDATQKDHEKVKGNLAIRAKNQLPTKSMITLKKKCDNGRFKNTDPQVSACAATRNPLTTSKLTVKSVTDHQNESIISKLGRPKRRNGKKDCQTDEPNDCHTDEPNDWHADQVPASSRVAALRGEKSSFVFLNDAAMDDCNETVNTEDTVDTNNIKPRQSKFRQERTNKAVTDHSDKVSEYKQAIEAWKRKNEEIENGDYEKEGKGFVKSLIACTGNVLQVSRKNDDIENRSASAALKMIRPRSTQKDLQSKSDSFVSKNLKNITSETVECHHDVGIINSTATKFTTKDYRDVEETRIYSGIKREMQRTEKESVFIQTQFLAETPPKRNDGVETNLSMTPLFNQTEGPVIGKRTELVKPSLSQRNIMGLLDESSEALYSDFAGLINIPSKEENCFKTHNDERLAEPIFTATFTETTNCDKNKDAYDKCENDLKIIDKDLICNPSYNATECHGDAGELSSHLNPLDRISSSSHHSIAGDCNVILSYHAKLHGDISLEAHSKIAPSILSPSCCRWDTDVSHETELLRLTPTYCTVTKKHISSIYDDVSKATDIDRHFNDYLAGYSENLFKTTNKLISPDFYSFSSEATSSAIVTCTPPKSSKTIDNDPLYLIGKTNNMLSRKLTPGVTINPQTICSEVTNNSIILSSTPPKISSVAKMSENDAQSSLIKASRRSCKMTTPDAPLRRHRSTKILRGIKDCDPSLIEAAVLTEDEDPNDTIVLPVTNTSSMANKKQIDLMIQGDKRFEGSSIDQVSENRKRYISVHPLFLAVMYSTYRVVQKLLDFGASVNAVDSAGRNSLHMLLLPEVTCDESGNPKKTLQFCDKNESIVENKNQRQRRLAKITSLLCQYGINLEKRDKDGRSPIDLAYAWLDLQRNRGMNNSSLASLSSKESSIRVLFQMNISAFTTFMSSFSSIPFSLTSAAAKLRKSIEEGLKGGSISSSPFQLLNSDGAHTSRYLPSSSSTSKACDIVCEDDNFELSHVSTSSSAQRVNSFSLDDTSTPIMSGISGHRHGREIRYSSYIDKSMPSVVLDVIMAHVNILKLNVIAPILCVDGENDRFTLPQSNLNEDGSKQSNNIGSFIRNRYLDSMTPHSHSVVRSQSQDDNKKKTDAENTHCQNREMSISSSETTTLTSDSHLVMRSNLESKNTDLHEEDNSRSMTLLQSPTQLSAYINRIRGRSQYDSVQLSGHRRSYELSRLFAKPYSNELVPCDCDDLAEMMLMAASPTWRQHPALSGICEYLGGHSCFASNPSILQPSENCMTPFVNPFITSESNEAEDPGSHNDHKEYQLTYMMTPTG